MQTSLADFIKNTSQGREAEAILRKCVHCGLCTATCPTYRLTGNELDSPRGRIYLIKSMLEGDRATGTTRLHLDRCLGCRACETTCPSGVEYANLLTIGRELAEQNSPHRSLTERVLRRILLSVLAYEKRFAVLLRAGRLVAPLLPHRLGAQLQAEPPGPWPPTRHQRRMIALSGCVQPAIAPVIDAAAARLLDRYGVSLMQVPKGGCCGGIALHLPAKERGLALVRKNIDAWWPLVEQGAESVVISASGCAVTVKEYGHLLRNDPAYAEKARVVSELAKDLSEVVAALELPVKPKHHSKIAFHSPCTLQHGQKINGVVESLLEQSGYPVVPVPNSHLCCGSAGTYSLLQPRLSRHLLSNKLHDLQSSSPDCIATANIGCLLHLRSQAKVPVRHWIELL